MTSTKVDDVISLRIIVLNIYIYINTLFTGAIIPALSTGSHQNSAVKRAWASVVLGWVTSWEVLVLHPFFRRISFSVSDD